MAKFKSQVNKNHSVPGLFQSPVAKYDRNASIKYKADGITPSVMYVKMPGPDGKPLPQEESYGTLYGAFDKLTKPPNADTDWNAYRQPHFKQGNLNIEPPDCSPPWADLKVAWNLLPSQPELMRNIANNMVGCERRFDPGGGPSTAGFDKPLAAQKEDVKAVAKSNAMAPPGVLENQQYGTWLKNQAAKVNMTLGHPLFAFLSGPEYFLQYAKKKGSTTHAPLPASATVVPVPNYAVDIADGVVLLWGLDNQYTQNAIYELTRNFGEDYGARLDQMMSIFDAVVAKESFKKKKALLKYGMLPSFGMTGTIPPAGAGKRAYNHDEGRRERKRRGDRAEEKAAIEFDEYANSILISNALQITEAIEDFIACAGQFTARSYKLHPAQYKTDRLNIVCGKENFGAYNPTELAAALSAELLAQRGEDGSKAGGPDPEDKRSILPWLAAGAGLIIGGPVGAAAGFTLGSALEKK